jgi:hypothetical protein
MLDVDDLYPEHPKLVGLGTWAEVAGWLNLAALCWCKRYLTDGVLPKAAVWRLASFRGMAIDGEAVTPESVAARLVAATLWTELEGDRYRIHDFLEYQESRDVVLERRRGDRDRKRKGLESRWSREIRPDSSRNPAGIRAESDRNPAGLQPDSDSPLPLPLPKRKDPDAHARAKQDPDQTDRTHRTELPSSVRRGIARAGPPRGGDPVRLGDLLAAAAAKANAPP